MPTNQPTSYVNVVPYHLSHSLTHYYYRNRTPPRVVSPPPVGSRSSSPLPPMPSSSTVTLRIPPAHSISELALPSTTFARRISDVPEELEQEDSSEEDARHIEIVENPRFAASNTNVSRRFSLRTSHTRDNSGSITTSSGTGTGTGSFSQPASSTLAPPNHSSPHTAPERERKSSGRFFSSIAGLFRGGSSIGSGHSSGTEKWKTRTQSNLQAVRRNADTDSEDDALTESPTRRFFGRRALRESSTPSSPATPQKLRKRKARQKEKDLDQGWISDGAAVGGRDARKASVKKRATLTDGSPRPASRPVPASAPMRSSSEVFVGSSLMSGSRPSTPSPTKPGAKPKADVRVQTIARSSNTNVSRQSSMRSTGSVPPVPRRNATERAASLPPLQSTPGSAIVSRSSSFQHGRSRSVTHTTPPPLPVPAHPDVGRHGAGSGQMSLMALVEGVTRNNRAAWDRANAGLPPEPAGSANKGGGLLSVRAPPSVSQYNLRGEGGTGISFESVLAPPSVLATPPPPPTTTTITPSSSSASTSRRPISLPPPPRLPMPPTPPGAAPKVPLRSALRNQSPPPKPPPKPIPIVIPSAPPRVIVASPSPSPMPNGGDQGDEGSDSGSIASFRTVRETLSESSSPTPPHAPSPAPTPALAPALASTSALAVPGQDESDVSTSTISANGGSGGGASGPTRRKSVRVSLQPTFSPTPPAIDEDEDAAWERSGRRRQPSSSSSSPPVVPPKRANGVAHYGDDEEDDGEDGRDDHARGKKGGRERDRDRERDFWADSSDEDEQYATARKMLTRAGKKRW